MRARSPFVRAGHGVPRQHDAPFRKTVCPHGEVARPALRMRGLLGQAEPILTAGGRAMGDDRAEGAAEDNGGLHSNCTRGCWLHVVGRT